MSEVESMSTQTEHVLVRGVSVKTDRGTRRSMPDAGPSFQWDEIAKHTSAKDCWVVIDAVVYDMTSFLPDHPGGKRLPLKYAGRDATAAWDSIHGHKKAQILEQWSYLRVGVVAADAGPPPAPEKSRRSKL